MVNITKCFIAFIDLMGFSSFVDNCSANEVHDLLSVFLRTPQSFNLKVFNYNINILSDSVIISSPVIYKEGDWKINSDFSKFIMFINQLQMANIISNGKLPVRGGISYGEFFTNNKDLMFGKGLIEAHQAESKLACYPRIIVTPTFLQPERSKAAHEALSTVFTNMDIKTSIIHDSLDEKTFSVRRDFDGLLHCNYLSSLRMLDGEWIRNAHKALIKHRDFILANIKKAAQNKSVAAKYHWMRTYHNWFCCDFDIFQDCLIENEATS